MNKLINKLSIDERYRLLGIKKQKDITLTEVLESTFKPKIKPVRETPMLKMSAIERNEQFIQNKNEKMEYLK